MNLTDVAACFHFHQRRLVLATHNPWRGFRNGDSRILILAEVHDGNITALYEYLQELAAAGASNYVGDEWPKGVCAFEKERRRRGSRRRSKTQAAAEAKPEVGTSEIVFRTCEAIW